MGIKNVQSWIIRLIAGWLADNITEETVKEWAKNARGLFIKWTDEIINRLEPEVKSSENKLDDAALALFKRFRDALLPPADLKL